MENEWKLTTICQTPTTSMLQKCLEMISSSSVYSFTWLADVKPPCSLLIISSNRLLSLTHLSLALRQKFLLSLLRPADPGAFCRPTNTPGVQPVLDFVRQRFCLLPRAQTTYHGLPISRAGFLFIMACNETFSMNGIHTLISA